MTWPPRQFICFRIPRHRPPPHPPTDTHRNATAIAATVTLDLIRIIYDLEPRLASFSIPCQSLIVSLFSMTGVFMETCQHTRYLFPFYPICGKFEEIIEINGTTSVSISIYLSCYGGHSQDSRLYF